MESTLIQVLGFLLHFMDFKASEKTINTVNRVEAVYYDHR